MKREDKEDQFLNHKRRADHELERPRENNNFYRSNDNRGQKNSSNQSQRDSNYHNKNGSNSHQSEQGVSHNSNNHVELPIHKHKSEILRSIEQNQVIIIAGETGCGKTTQVPQYIYRGLKQKGEKVNILITQPRRIAAYSIARRLSQEMKVNLGEEVGYHYGMTPVFRQDKTEILIMTTGIFLQRIVHEKKLDDFTHIILDEVHERDIDIDFVLVLVKFLLMNNSNTKLILMSATIATTLFANYFSRTSIVNILNNVYEEEKKQNKELEANLSKIDNTIVIEKKSEETQWVWGESQDYTKNNYDQISVQGIFTVTEINKDEKKNFSNSELLHDSAPIVRIDQRIYNVNIFYLDTFIERLGHDLRKSYNTYNTNFDKKNPKIDQNLYEIALDLIINIHKRNVYTKEPQGRCYHVLVFLPGFAEIETMYQILYTKLSPDEKSGMEILKLHSNLQE
jgi:HrpA-like RNA helicase